MSKVVVIGGGPSAKHCAEQLVAAAKKVKGTPVEVTVVQAHPYVEWPLAMPSVLCKPDTHDQAIAANPATFQVKGATLLFGVAETVDVKGKTLTIKQSGGNTTTLPYTVLVVCTGFRLPVFSPSPGQSLAERKAEVRRMAESIQKASSVAVIGGGPIGIEMAGIVKHVYPDKKVMLACRDGLLKTCPEKRQTKISEVLKSRGIEVMHGLSQSPQDFAVDASMEVSGASVKCDVVIPCYQRGPATEFFSGTNLLDEKGYLKVNDYLQCSECPDVFAIGGCSNKEPLVMLAKLSAQWAIVTNNVMAQLQSKPLKAHKEAVPFMKNPPITVIAPGKGGWAGWDFDELPPVAKCCCCWGKCGFPCCPAPLCWCCPAPCGPCCCGYCCGPPEGEGVARALGPMAYKSMGFHFKGIGEAAPAQQTM